MISTRLIIILVSIVIFSCNRNTAPPVSTMHTEGLHHKWKITKMKDGEAEKAAYIDMRDVYRSGASAGCRYFAFTPKFGYRNRMQADNLLVHFPSCTGNNTDELLLHHLKEIYSFSLSDNRLQLSAKNGDVLLEAEKAADDENGSVARKWYIQQMINADNDQLLKNKALMDWTDPDKAAATVGCNRFSFSVEANNAYSIRIDKVVSTRMFCKDVASNEEVFTKVLPLVNKYQVIGNKLKLFDKDDVLLMEAIAALH